MMMTSHQPGRMSGLIHNVPTSGDQTSIESLGLPIGGLEAVMNAKLLGNPS